LLACGVLVLALAGCHEEAERREAIQMTGGNPEHGAMLIRRYGCHACHTIPGIEGATALVGPPLDRIAGRVYLAGRLPNTTQNLMRWIEDPQRVSPGTAMPDVGVTSHDARDIAAYLYTLR
jgi:cytochrome c2